MMILLLSQILIIGITFAIIIIEYNFGSNHFYTKYQVHTLRNHDQSYSLQDMVFHKLSKSTLRKEPGLPEQRKISSFFNKQS